MLLCSKKHFSALAYKSFARSLCSTSRTILRCSLRSFPKIKMSSKYTITWPCCIRSPRMLFIIAWKVAGALEKPKYMTVASNRPRFVMNAVFHSSPSRMRTLLYPQRTLNLVKTVALTSLSITSEIKGIGYAFLMVISLRRR